MPTVHLLDYVAGNIRSLVNAIEKVGYQVEWIKSPEDVPNAEVQPTPPKTAIQRRIDRKLTRTS
jgi:imidazoleglycerol phosphate synthase glutamine amidotransferase subunit HisH